MAFWEFLIQKEGDRSWLPLESPDVEVLEGRYRVVARSSRVNSAVEICVSHINIEANPPKQRIQKRLSQTNPDGLVVVIPFTRFHPGVWELRCTGDLMSDMLGEGWRYAVRLQVLPHHSEQLGDWDLDDPDSNTTPLTQPAPLDERPEEPEARRSNPEVAVDAVTAQATGLEPDVESAAISEEAPAAISEEAIAVPTPPEPPAVAPILPAVPEREAPLTPLAAVPPAPVPPAPAPPASAPRTSSPVVPIPEPSTAQADAAPEVPDEFPAVELVLAQTLYVATWGHTLQVAGQLEPLETDASGALSTMPAACLHLTLRNPQTADVVTTLQQPLESGSLPYPFRIEVTVPDNENTRLLLGDVVLTSAATAVPSEELATAAFTITTDLNHLLEAIANDFLTDVYPPVEFVEQSVESNLDLSLLNLVKSSRASQVVNSPSFEADLDDQPAIVADGVQLQAGSGWVEVSVPAAPVPASSKPYAEPDPIADEPLEWDVVECDSSGGPSRLALPAANTPLDQEPDQAPDQGFQSLNLQNRFLSRLSALASDAELSESIQVDAPPLGLDDTLAAQEFVLHDDVPLPPVRTSITAQPRQKAPEPEPAILSEDEPVPTPTLTLPATELIAGKQIDVLVTLPELQSRLYVKLWVRDRQTHTILDGPRWVMHLNPNGRGGQQAQTVMTIPFGCLEAQFEAIAIEMATQRESHKVTIPRNVIPPDLPTISVDELEL